MAKKVIVCFAVIVLIAPVFAALSFAQVDPEKALIGRWRSQETNLPVVINSVKATGNDEWVGYASAYGGNIEIDIWKKDNEIYLRWISVRNGAPYRLKMTGDDQMEGTVGGFQLAHGMSGTPGHWVEGNKATFKKVKAGNVK